MTKEFLMLAFAISLVSEAAQSPLKNDREDQLIVFRAQHGSGVIVWDKSAETLSTPYSVVAQKASDCSDEFQTCLTDGRGFAFSYFRNCDDVDDNRLKYRPKVVAAVHNEIWMVYDAAPNYMFHYSIPEGITGIYVAPDASFDFRQLLRNRTMQLKKYAELEYRAVGSVAIAACKMKSSGAR